MTTDEWMQRVFDAETLEEVAKVLREWIASIENQKRSCP